MSVGVTTDQKQKQTIEKLIRKCFEKEKNS
jgi:hypothetical protein